MNEIPREVHSDNDELDMIETVKIIRDTLDSVSKSLAVISQYGRRTRQMAVSLILSLMLDVTLTIVVAILSLTAVSQTSTLRNIQYTTCISSNEARSDQIRLWALVIQISEDGSKQTASEKNNIDKLIRFVNSTFKPRTCVQ